MEQIKLLHALPTAFHGQTEAASDVWRREFLFQKGESYLIEAASGTGKTSLCSFIYGQRNDYKGSICFDAKNIRELKVSDWQEIRRLSLSMLFQELRLFPELTAWENIELKNRLTSFRKKCEIEGYLEYLDIADKRNVPVGKLSFGQQQRVAFIRALCQPFDFILLDEPVSHLDESNGAKMAALLQEETARQGAGVLVTSIGKHLPLDYSNILHL